MGRAATLSKRAKLQQRHAQHRYTESLRRNRMKTSLAEIRRLLSLKPNMEQASVMEAAVIALRDCLEVSARSPSVTSSVNSGFHDSSASETSNDSYSSAASPNEHHQVNASMVCEAVEARNEASACSDSVDLMSATPTSLDTFSSETMPSLDALFSQIPPTLDVEHLLLDTTPSSLDLPPTFQDSVIMMSLDATNTIVNCNSSLAQAPSMSRASFMSSTYVSLEQVFPLCKSCVFKALADLRQKGRGAIGFRAAVALGTAEGVWREVTATLMPGGKKQILLTFDLNDVCMGQGFDLLF
eukprot:TRINITY_DN7109_c0_g1_i1.p1 TRINITY_DN7109_c0_g1~~TRINITY_DN7109_c0_g1_i1.p1  ORF type:complete len:298 (+),score=57.33 TRINITY_DN7109_c0_g1_i1:492-1385(+)